VTSDIIVYCCVWRMINLVNKHLALAVRRPVDGTSFVRPSHHERQCTSRSEVRRPMGTNRVMKGYRGDSEAKRGGIVLHRYVPFKMQRTDLYKRKHIMYTSLKRERAWRGTLAAGGQ
jgi:hypothetical protein